MCSVRSFVTDDLFNFNHVNLDLLTETYNLPFYLRYLSRWPEYFLAAQSPNRECMGYIMGKAEGVGDNWHGHISAVTVAPRYRRLGLAGMLIQYLEDITEEVHDGYFVDLFVRMSNLLAINMYKKFGYVVYRQVLGYYAGEEDAFDMRKAMARDVDKKSMIPLDHPIHPEDLECD